MFYTGVNQRMERRSTRFHRWRVTGGDTGNLPKLLQLLMLCRDRTSSISGMTQKPRARGERLIHCCSSQGYLKRSRFLKTLSAGKAIGFSSTTDTAAFDLRRVFTKMHEYVLQAGAVLSNRATIMYARTPKLPMLRKIDAMAASAWPLLHEGDRS